MAKNVLGDAAKLTAAHALLFTFTLFLSRKLDHVYSGSWWHIFTPLWLFHAVVVRWRFSIPAPIDPYDCYWPPYHDAVGPTLLFAFEVLLCLHAENSSAVNLKIVFVPILLLGVIIIIDNFRMCFRLFREEERHPNENLKWEITIRCSIILSMGFILAATVIMVQMLAGEAAAVNWLMPYIVFSIGQFFAFLVCTEWTGDEEICLLVPHVVAKREADRRCTMRNIVGHIMKFFIVAFQVLLIMRLQETPSRAEEISFRYIFSPLLFLQGGAVLLCVLKFLELCCTTCQIVHPRARDFLEFMLDGSRLLGWWSFDEVSRKPEARIVYNCESRSYNFCNNPSVDELKKMSKRSLLEELWTMQVLLIWQTRTVKAREQHYEDLQQAKPFRICIMCNGHVDTLFLPCKHFIHCGSCAKKLEQYPTFKPDIPRMPQCPWCKSWINQFIKVHDA